MQPTPRNSGNESSAPGLLPNLCDNRVLLLLMLIAELLAIVLTLSQRPGTRDLWAYLATTSFFIQSITLVDAALLCYARRWLLKLPPLYLGVTVYVALQVVTVLITLLQGLVID